MNSCAWQRPTNGERSSRESAVIAAATPHPVADSPTLIQAAPDFGLFSVPRTCISRIQGEKSAKTKASPDGQIVVDYNGAGRVIGVEITAPQAVSLERLNQLLDELGEVPCGARVQARSSGVTQSSRGSRPDPFIEDHCSQASTDPSLPYHGGRGIPSTRSVKRVEELY